MPESEVQIITFEREFAEDFARLNYEWIEQYFTVEAHDREMLDYAEEFIIKRGGQIFFALVKENPVGTVALIKTDTESFELAKMAVAKDFQGKKIGDKLMAACIEYSKKVGIKRIFLLSNTKLTPAINLYKKFGFQEVPLEAGLPYSRVDIKMELLLENTR